MIEVDGSYGEGGGQLVRTAVALSALTGSALRLAGVRAKRARPGLAPQHLAAVRAVAALCNARCEGLELRSSGFTFEPRTQAAGGEVRVEIGTAGSVTLVLQALLPILLGAPRASRVVVTGGTDVRQAPTWDYFCEVLVRLLRGMGVRMRTSLTRRGYYPGGGGEASVEVEPAQPRALLPKKLSGVWKVSGEAHVARLPLSIAERMRAAALAALPRDARIGARMLDHAHAVGAGGAITVWAESGARVLGASRVAERGVRAEALGEAVAAELGADMASGADLDLHAADQVLVYLAMAREPSSFAARALSSHAHTTMWLIDQFLPARFRVESEGMLTRIRTTPGI